MKGGSSSAINGLKPSFNAPSYHQGRVQFPRGSGAAAAVVDRGYTSSSSSRQQMMNSSQQSNVANKQQHISSSNPWAKATTPMSQKSQNSTQPQRMLSSQKKQEQSLPVVSHTNNLSQTGKSERLYQSAINSQTYGGTNASRNNYSGSISSIVDNIETNINSSRSNGQTILHEPQKNIPGQHNQFISINQGSLQPPADSSMKAPVARKQKQKFTDIYSGNNNSLQPLPLIGHSINGDYKTNQPLPPPPQFIIKTVQFPLNSSESRTIERSTNSSDIVANYTYGKSVGNTIDASAKLINTSSGQIAQERIINNIIAEQKAQKIKNGSSTKMELYKFDFSFRNRSVAGLRNIGNTCFMNSALQCVMNTPVFNELFFDGKYEKQLNQAKNKGVSDNYASLIQQVRSASSSSQVSSTASLKYSIGKLTLFSNYRRPQYLIQEKVSRQFRGFDQQDSHELLRTLLDGLHEELNLVRVKPVYQELNADIKKKNLQTISDDWFDYYRKRDDSWVIDFFCGQLYSKVVCQQCKQVSVAFDNYMDLALGFGPDQQSSTDLESLLKQFFREESLHDYLCTQCKKETKKTRKFELFKLPRILVFQLKRFKTGGGFRDKISSSVSFPVDTLDLAPYIESSSDPSVSNAMYTLFGIVNQTGNLSGGHYTAESLNPYDGQWYNFNDIMVSPILLSQIMRYESQGRSSPYLLFYCKKELLQYYRK